jgi:succinate-acetate transporter protein
MRVFKVPFDIKREEKIFGGYLSLRQVIYLMLGASSFSICAIPIPIAIKIIFISLFVTFFLLCTFLKIGEQNFDKYFFYAMKFIFRKKDFVYERCGKW